MSSFTGKFYPYKNNSSNRKLFGAQLSQIGYELGDTYGDGNCQFYAIAEHVTPISKRVQDGDDDQADKHACVRCEVCEYIKANAEEFSMYLDTDETEGLDEYLEEMKQDGTWGDNLTLQAAAELYKLEIVMFRFTGKSGTPFRMCISPKNTEQGTQTIYLAYWMNQHYDVVSCKV